MKDKTFYQDFFIFIGIAIFFLIGGMALGGVLNGGSAWSFFKSPPRLAVVDMQALITRQSQHLVKTSSKKAPDKASKVSSRQIQEAGEQLKETLEAFATKHHLIFLSKGAVMGGNLPDYTNEVMEDAFPDYTATLMAFLKNRIASEQPKNLRHEGFRFEGLRSKDQKPQDQGSVGQRPVGQENQP